MKKRTVRIFAIVLAALMCLSLLPLAAHAEEPVIPEGFDLVDGELVHVDHVYNAEVVDDAYLYQEGDCTTPAVYWRSCGVVNPVAEERCGHSAGEAYAAEMAALKAEMETRKAAGEKEKDLLAVAAVMAEEIEARYADSRFEVPGDHNFVEGVCTVCGEPDPNYVAPVEEHTEHSWDEGVVTLEPTCAAAGQMTYTCTVCGETMTEEIAATGDHSWDEGVVTLEPTCAAAGQMTYTCTVCGETMTEEIAATGDHSWDDGVVTLEPTCAAAGQMTYTCTVCGETVTEDIEATGEHSWNDGVVTLEPTCAAAGEMTYTCTVCGETMTEEIAATGEHSWDEGVCTECGESDPNYNPPQSEEQNDNADNMSQGDGNDGFTDDDNDGYTDEGNDNGTVEGNDNDTVEGDDNGTVEGDDNGTVEGDDNGTVEGNDNGTVEGGSDNDTVEGGDNGEPQGGDNGEPQGEGNDGQPQGDGNDGQPQGEGNDGQPQGEGNDGQPQGSDNSTVEGGSKNDTVEGGSDNGENKGDADDENKAIDFKKTNADPARVESFKDNMSKLGLDAEKTEILSVQDITPVYSDDTEVTDEEVEAMGGLEFEMDLPEDYDPADEPNVFHFNEKTGEWERMEIVKVDVENRKITVKAKSFSPFAFVAKKAGTASPFASNQKRLGTGTFLISSTPSETTTFDAPATITVELTVANAPEKHYIGHKANDGITLLSSDASKNVITASGTIPSGYTYQWVRESADGSETEIRNANSSSYTLQDNDLNYGIICTVRDLSSNEEAARSEVLRVRKEITVGFTIRGYGEATLSYSRIGGGKKDIQISTGTSEVFLTGDNITVSMEPDTAQGYRFRQIATARPTDDYWTPVRSINLGNADEPYEFSPSYDIELLLQCDKENLYNETKPTKGADDNIEKNKKDVLKKLWTTLGTKLDSSKYNYRYITPIWKSDALYMTAKEVAAIGGFDIEMDAPKAGKNETVELYHFKGDYESGSWEKVEEAYVDGGKVYVDQFMDFSPFAAVVVPGESEDPVVGDEIKITFKPGDMGTGSMPDITRKSGTKSKLPVNTFKPKNENYAFNGWLDEKSGEGYADGGTITVPDKNITLTAQWKRVKYTVTYDGNEKGGDPSDASLKTQTVAVDTPVIIRDNMFTVPYGKVFGGWNTKANGKGDSYKAGDTKTFNDDVTLYAIWSEETKIFYYPNGGDGSYKEQTVVTDTPFKLQTLEELGFKAKSGQTFASWNHNEDGSGKENYADGATVTIKTGATEEERKFYAQWGEPVTISFNANGGSGTMANQSAAKDKETALNANTFTRSGCFFNGWNTKADGSGTAYADGATIKTSKDRTLYAQWIGPLEVFKGKTSATEVSIGETLTAKLPNLPKGSSITYEWYRLASSTSTTGTKISGATGKTYVPTMEDMGSVLLCRATDNSGKTVNSVNRVTVNSIEWVQDIVNNNTLTRYTPVAQPGQIKGVADGMEYSIDGGKWSEVSGAKDGVWNVSKPGVYSFRSASGSVASQTITIYSWYTVGYTVTTASGTTATSSGVRMYLNGDAMPTYLFDNPLYRDRYDVLRYSTTGYSTTSSSTSYASAYTLYAVKANAAPGTITLSVTPPSSTYAHVTLYDSTYPNGGTIGSWGSTTTTTVNGITRTTTLANATRSFECSIPKDAPRIYTIVFNNSATSPRTGDESNLGLWSALCLVSLTGAATILTESRKRRKNRA